jgi:hypothetical protein
VKKNSFKTKNQGRVFYWFLLSFVSEIGLRLGFLQTRTRTNTNPNGTEANAAGRSVRALHVLGFSRLAYLVFLVPAVDTA